MKGGKHMYISQFWCGVGAVLLAELVTLIIYTIIYSVKHKK